MILRALRITANALLWVLAVIGVLSAGLWIAHTAGWVQPLVVVSGSMSPGIETGDLVFSTPIRADEASVGQVATLMSQQTGDYVTHRITSVTANGGQVDITMRGDANRVDDPEVYQRAASDTVWTPWFIVPGGGFIIANLLRPAVLIPAVIGVLALIVLPMIPTSREREEDAVEDESARELSHAA